MTSALFESTLGAAYESVEAFEGLLPDAGAPEGLALGHVAWPFDEGLLHPQKRSCREVVPSATYAGCF